MYEISKDPISDIFCWLSSFSSMHFLNMEEPLLQKPQRKRFLQSNYYRRKIFDASLLLLQKRVFGGTDLLSVSFKSLAIVLCVFISCFSIQFFCLEKKKRIGLGWIATLLWKTKTILSPPMPIFYFHSEKNCASQFCTTVTVGGKVCTRLFQNL